MYSGIDIKYKRRFWMIIVGLLLLIGGRVEELVIGVEGWRDIKNILAIKKVSIKKS